MNLKDAFTKMFEGQKIRHKHWNPGSYLEIKDGIAGYIGNSGYTDRMSPSIALYTEGWEIWKDPLECEFQELKVGETFTHKGNPGQVYMKTDSPLNYEIDNRRLVIVIKGHKIGSHVSFPLNEIVKREKLNPRN